MNLIPNGWKLLFKTDTSQKKNLIKALYHPYKGTRKVEDFSNFCYNEVFFTFQSNSINNTKNLLNSFDGKTSLKHHILSQESFDEYIFSVWYTSFFSSLKPCITYNK